ncbi:MAG: thioredoxin family protein [Sterolibacteriaceae bacterium MAG5]|nr:thioredoxin family protein [Candidatus Nitricoxidireducens bremensis]
MIRRLFLVLLFLAAGLPPWAQAADPAGRVDLHFFWSHTCPHCQAARPFVETLAQRLPWLALHSHEVSQDPVARERYRTLAAELGEEARSVPAFIFCGRLEVGFDDAATTGRELEAALVRCREGGPSAAPDAALTLPLLGRIDPARWSLPVFTLVIASLDAFNPCAFFVLLFLLSLLVHAGSRARMLYVGGVFLFFSGFVYFLFMAAWLNVFRWLGELTLVTAAAGALALVVAALNIKDYFLFKQGPSLSIPESAKPGLFQRMRGLLKADSLPALTVGTVVLAVAANSYELLCTAGFPMVYTRLLTLADLPPGAHYAYLAAYNVVYVLPLLAITLAFTFTLGSRKLSEAEGRFLKLLSGLMMLGLGVLLLAAPEALNDLRVALALLGGAVGGAWIMDRAGRR